MTLRDALDRTLLLMRDNIRNEAPDDLLLDALLGTRIVIAGDAANLATHSAQSAFVTAAMLCARAGATVYLHAPDVLLAGAQPPLCTVRLIGALTEIDLKLIPKTSFVTTAPAEPVDLAVVVGDSEWRGEASLVLSINADDWSGWISEIASARRWTGTDWPLGGLAAAALVAAEGYKAAMRKLRHWRTHEVFDEFFAPTLAARVRLAPTSTPCIADLGRFDFVSGGAIAHSAIFALARVPAVRGDLRVIEHDINDISNANRYPLLRLERLHLRKASDLATQRLGGLRVSAIAYRYDAANLDRIGKLASAVLVGVDHIPTRWEVDKASPDWLGIGATSHYSVMITIHQSHLPCVECAHPRDDPGTGPIPTVGFVSFWSGLFVAARYMRYLACGTERPEEQQTWFCPLHPEEKPQFTRVHVRHTCSCDRNSTRDEMQAAERLREPQPQ